MFPFPVTLLFPVALFPATLPLPLTRVVVFWLGSGFFGFGGSAGLDDSVCVGVGDCKTLCVGFVLTLAGFARRNGTNRRNSRTTSTAATAATPVNIKMPNANLWSRVHECFFARGLSHVSVVINS